MEDLRGGDGELGWYPHPEDSLKFACMDVGYSVRPVPPGTTKGRHYCLRCTAERCIHGGSVKERQKRMRMM